MKFVVGIGNPEKQYEKTRHNVGFRVLDAWCAKASGVWRDKKKLCSRLCSLDMAHLIKPMTYVNNTGEAARALLQKPGASPADFLFVCDDVNLRFGKIRLRGSGSAGGHHGLESVIAALGIEDFPRLRIGVGGESTPKDDLTEYVLGNFSRQEESELGLILGKAVSVCETWVEKDLESAMRQLSVSQGSFRRDVNAK